ncbi:MAG TPA: hypothetical protein VNT99_08115, partial [Methylomirabilota bacterium]|nr:hypothetical protein [Methylomirabilota bacterium]
MVQHAWQNANEKEERQNMLGLFKRMLSRQEAPHPAPPATPAPIAKPKASPPVARVAVPAQRTTTPMRVQVTSSLSKPAPTPVETPEVSPPPAASTHVQVALATIAASLPEAISHKVPANSDQFVAIPLDRILPQLANGQVVMTAAELREYAPDYLAALAGLDDFEITLPLGDIVKQLSPEHFGRRSQRRSDVPAEVMPIFAGSAGVNTTRPALAQSAPVQRAHPTITTTTPAAPVSAPPGKISMSAHALASLNAKASTPFSPPAVPTHKPPTPGSSPAPAFSRPPATVQKKAFPPKAKVTGHLKVPLAAVCVDWIDEVQAQLAGVDVTQSEVFVPLELLEPAMKSGKALFSWQEVAGWIQPPLSIPPTPKVGEMPVELSLKVIAPLFMSNHRGGAQKRLAVDEAIPDLFTGGDGNALVQPSVPASRATSAPLPTSLAPRITTPAISPKPEPVKAAPATAPVAAAPVAGQISV